MRKQLRFPKILPNQPLLPVCEITHTIEVRVSGEQFLVKFLAAEDVGMQLAYRIAHTTVGI